MPTRQHPGRVPPTLVDRILAHPWSLGVGGIYTAYCGGVLLVATILGDARATVSEVGYATALALGIFALVGGLHVIAGVLWRGADSTGWTLEVIGLCLGGGAWATWLAVERDPYVQTLAAVIVACASVRITAAYLSREGWHRRQARAALVRRLRG